MIAEAAKPFYDRALMGFLMEPGPWKDRQRVQRQDRLLRRSKHFCMMPWVHLHVWPNGNAFPCCIANSDQPVDSVNRAGLKGAWNSEKMRELRQRMLADEPSETCHRCYFFEQNSRLRSTRKFANYSFAKYWDLVESTGKDGSVADFHMPYMDIRFSNLCNFKCRSCGPELSSSWHEDQKALWPDWDREKVIRPENTLQFWDELEPVLHTVDKVYFAGGEPLITEEHYRVLEHWLKTDKKNVEITYTTNFSQLTFGSRNVVDLWKQFSNVKVCASLDDSGARAELMRKGTKWDRIEANRRTLMEEAPHVKFSICPTISILNVWHFPEFHQDWIERGLVDLNELDIHILTFPQQLSVANLSGRARSLLAQRYQKAEEWVVAYARARRIPCERAANGYRSVRQFLETAPSDNTSRSTGGSDVGVDFILWSKKLDLLRQEETFRVFPELTVLLRDGA